MAETFEGKGYLFRGGQLVASVRYRLRSERDAWGHSEAHGEISVVASHWSGTAGESFVMHTEDGFSLPLELPGRRPGNGSRSDGSLGGRWPMACDKHSWNRYLRNTRSALVKRDALAGGAQGSPAGEQGDVERERRAWAAKARANLKQLARLAERAPDRSRALETFHELRKWYENPRGMDRRGRR